MQRREYRLFGISLAGRASDSESEGPRFEPWIPRNKNAQMVELVDTRGLEPRAVRRESSSLSLGKLNLIWVNHKK